MVLIRCRISNGEFFMIERDDIVRNMESGSIDYRTRAACYSLERGHGCWRAYGIGNTHESNFSVIRICHEKDSGRGTEKCDTQRPAKARSGAHAIEKFASVIVDRVVVPRDREHSPIEQYSHTI